MIAKKITLSLPWPRFTSNSYQVWKGKGYTLKPAVKRFRAEIRVIWLQNERPVLSGKLLLRINVFPPDKRKRDLDNLIKQVQDALQLAGFFADDNQIDELHIIRRHVEVPGCLQVLLEEIGS